MPEFMALKHHSMNKCKSVSLTKIQLEDDLEILIKCTLFQTASTTSSD